MISYMCCYEGIGRAEQTHNAKNIWRSSNKANKDEYWRVSKPSSLPCFLQLVRERFSALVMRDLPSVDTVSEYSGLCWWGAYLGACTAMTLWDPIRLWHCGHLLQRSALVQVLPHESHSHSTVCHFHPPHLQAHEPPANLVLP